MNSSSGSQAGSKKERQNWADVIAMDPLNKPEQEVSSSETTRDEVGTIENDTEDRNKESDSGGESDEFEPSESEQYDIIELDRGD
jgi:hypothetical protein